MARSVRTAWGINWGSVRVFRGISHKAAKLRTSRGEPATRSRSSQAPALGGRFRVLGYASENEFDAAATVTSTADGASDDSGRNVFEWESLSLGGEWAGSIDRIGLRVLGWSAASEASSAWLGSGDRLGLSSERQDRGALVVVRHHGDPMDRVAAATEAGLRVERSETSYAVVPEPGGTQDASFLSLDARTPVVTAFAHHSRLIAPRLELDLGASLASFEESWRPAPTAGLRWTVRERITLSGRYSRTHQYAQSLSNPESIARNLFPADLFVGAARRGCRSRRAISESPESSGSRREPLASGSKDMPAASTTWCWCRSRTRSRSRPRRSTSAPEHPGELRPMHDGAREGSGSR